MMRTTPTPKPERAPRSFWFDPRFGVGIALVVASVLGVTFLVATADRTEQVWAATRAISPGDIVDSDDLELRAVRLGDVGEFYLASGDLPEAGLVVTRAVARGELLPASAVGAAASTKLASVVVGVDAELPQAVAAGSVVDLWSAAPIDRGGYGPPSVLVSSATVVRIVEAEGIVTRGEASGVEVLVPRARIAMVLEALANGHSISLVPVSVPVAEAAGR